MPPPTPSLELNGETLQLRQPLRWPPSLGDKSEGQEYGFIYLKVDLAPELQRLRHNELLFQLPLIATLLLLATALSLWLHYHLVIPLQQLIQASRTIGTERERPLPEQWLGELGQLAIAFNQMLQRLSEQHHQLTQSEYELTERMKELSCLYDIFRITEEHTELASMFSAIVKRLPAAMRYPAQCAALIECADSRYGRKYDGPTIHQRFCRDSDHNCTLSVSYRLPPPEGEVPAFIPEEITLLEAIAKRLAESVKRHQEQQQLEDNLALMSAILEQAPDAIELADPKSMTIIEANPASCNMLGYHRHERIGQAVAAFQAELTQDQLDHIAAEVQQHGHSSFVTQHRHKEGHVIDVHVNIGTLTLRQHTYMLAMWRDISAEKRVQNQLNRLYLAVEQSSESIVITNLEAEIEYVNAAFTEATGYSREEALGQNPRILQSGRTPQSVYREMWARLQLGMTWQGELINQRKDGSEYIEHARISPVRLESGQISHYLAIKEDITQRIELQEELERHRHHLEDVVTQRTAEQQAILDSANSGIMLVIDRRIVSCNQRTYGIFGWHEGDLIHRSTRVLFADEDGYEQFSQQAYPKIWAGHAFACQRQMVRHNGSRFWTRITGRAIDHHHPDKGSVWVIDDITEDRMAADALLLAYQEQQAIFETASSGIALIQHRVLIRCNQRLHEIFGWPEGEMVGQKTRIWYTSEEEAQIDTASYTLIWNGETHKREQQLLRRDGSRFWARLAGAAVSVDDPDKGTVWVVDDISAEHEALEQLAEAKALAESAAQLKSDFLANMSHEIRTPMNAIIGTTHLALKSSLTPKQRNYLERIQLSGRHLLGLINDILDLSKIEAGKLELEQRSFNLNQVIESVTTLIYDQSRTKELQLQVWINPDVPRALVGDPLRLGQILINFGTNAVKFTDQGRISLTLSSLTRTSEQVELRFEISDTGIGISPEQQRRLFRQFEQADPSTTRQHGGTGLGLAISKQLVELMRGKVGVHSALGKGSTFWVTLPFSLSKMALEELHATESSLALEENPKALSALKGATLLLVEDNEINRDVATELLQEGGFGVDWAENGAVAVQKVAQKGAAGYSAILMDIQMPVMDGLTATTEILKLPQGKQTPIIAMTANALAEDRQRCLQAGMSGYLAKPIVPAELWQQLLQLAKRPTSQAPAPPPAPPSPESAPSLDWRQLPGIDASIALSHTMGKEALLLKLIHKFARNHRSFMTELTQTLQKGDRESARRIAHTLKGSAAQIGLRELSQMAATIETAITSGKELPLLEQPLADLTPVLDQLIHAILRHLPPPQGSATPERGARIDLTAFEPLRAELTQQLEMSNIASLKTVERHTALLQSYFGADYDPFIDAVESFDFESALAQLNRLATLTAKTAHRSDSPPHPTSDTPPAPESP
ncbi:PAS domain S-box protein [Ectothiorhodospiraceae bacterium BW-2]|nr:PAS domain S-box protein [Ectothiorhodospiraceae bacterium BW-2]